MFGRRSVAHVAPQRQAGPIPIGWMLETEVRKDGTTIPFYYCPATGQLFFTYFEPMRYVKYAQSKGLGIYRLARKSVKRIRSLEKHNNANESKKKSSLSLPRKPSSKSNSSTVGLSLDSKPSNSSGCTDKETDPNYLHEPEVPR